MITYANLVTVSTLGDGTSKLEFKVDHKDEQTVIVTVFMLNSCLVSLAGAVAQLLEKPHATQN